MISTGAWPVAHGNGKRRTKEIVMSRTMFAVSLVFALAAGSQVRAEMFLNSGFETGAFPSTTPTNEFPILTWRSWGYSDPTFFWNASNPQAYTGNVSGAHFGGLAPSEGIFALAAQQVVDVYGTLSSMKPGQQYVMDWADAARQSGANLGSAYQLLINGNVVFGGATGFAPTNCAAYTNRESASFVATGTDTIRLCFLGNPDGDSTTLIDNMSYHAVPEPSALALLATGLVGLLAYAWRKRR
jgi:hypothetical protein